MGGGRARRYIAVDPIQAVSVVGSRSASAQLLAAAGNGHSHARPDSPIEQKGPSSVHRPSARARSSQFGQAVAENEQLEGREGRRERTGRTDLPIQQVKWLVAPLSYCSSSRGWLPLSLSMNDTEKGGSNFPTCILSPARRVRKVADALDIEA